MKEKIFCFNTLTGSITIFAVLTVMDAFDIPSMLESLFGLYEVGIMLVFLAVSFFYYMRQESQWGFWGEADTWLVKIWTGLGLWYAGYWNRMGAVSRYGRIILLFLPVLTCMILKRIWRVKKEEQEKSTKQKKENLHDLRNLYENRIECSDSGIIFLKEEDVDYDLLGRENLISKMEKAIRWCETDRRFVIGLDGVWGSGKTTILNIVKKRLKNVDDIIVIDQFKPWDFQDEKSMVNAMLESILREIRGQLSWIEGERLKRELIHALFEGSGYWKLLRLLGVDHEYQPAEIGKRINRYLEASEKKLVFVIDDIERADEKNIFLLFNMVGNILYLNHMIYVLSYDKEQINRILEQRNLKPDYLKKIVQLELKVPMPSKERMLDITETCLKNMLNAYGRCDQLIYDADTYHPVIENIVAHFSDIRDMKRFFNSVVTWQLVTKNYLNPQDMIRMELIHEGNPDLYASIYENGRFFVSDDVIYERDYYLTSMGAEKFNKEAKAYFDHLFENPQNQKYQDMLSEMFPYVKRYMEKHDIKGTWPVYSDGHHKEFVKERRICNARYFSLYFTQQSNEFVEICDEVEHWIRKAEGLSGEENRAAFEKILHIVPESAQHLVIEMLQLYSDSFTQKQAEVIFSVLYDSLLDLDDSMSFMILSARRYAMHLMAGLMEQLSESMFEHWISEIEGAYQNLYVVEGVLASSGKKDVDGNRVYEGRGQILHEKLLSMAEHICSGDLNIYEDPYYSEGNMWTMYHMLNERGERAHLYAQKVINSKTIYRFLWDMVQKGVGSGYMYSFKKENMELFCSYEDVDHMLEEHRNHQGETEDEYFVRQVYEARDKEGFDEREICTAKEKKTESVTASGMKHRVAYLVAAQ